MEADYVLTYTALMIILGLLVSSFNIYTGSDVTEFLVAIAEASQKPGSVLEVRVLLGEGASITCDGRRITVKNAVIPRDVIKLYRSYGIGDGDSGSITLSMDINSFRMDGGYIYTVLIESTPSKIIVKIAETRKI